MTTFANDNSTPALPGETQEEIDRHFRQMVNEALREQWRVVENQASPASVMKGGVQ